MRILSVDLASKSYSFRELDLDESKFPGGKVLGLYLLARYLLEHEVNEPHNAPVYVTVGPLEGLFPGAARAGFHAISPHTGLVLDSYAGGTLGRNIKALGIDVIELKGVSDSRVYLVIDEQGISFEDASEFLGKGVYEVHKKLKEKYPKASTMIIGPAGENLVTFSVVMVDRDHAFGRSGSGRHFGKRKLKAIVVNPPERPKFRILHPDIYRRVVREVTERSLRDKSFVKYGTQVAVSFANFVGQLPVKNFRTTHHKDAEKVSAAVFEKDYIRSDPCLPCPVGCRKITRLNGGEVSGPEYETIAMTGTNTLTFDPEYVKRYGYLCNDLGLDSITTGNTIARYLERLEREKGTNKWNDHEYKLELIRKIALRIAEGEVLSLGVKKASEKLGGLEYAVHVKGLEAPARDPRGRLGAALSYATADVGASHLRGFPDREPPGKPLEKRHVESLIKNRDRKALKDSLIVCTFTGWTPELADEAFYALTGKHLDPLIGRRAENIARVINLHLKPDLKDEIPKRRRESVPDGPAKGMRAFLSEEEFHKGLQRFYELRLWDERGRPTEESLRKTSVEDLIGLLRV